MISPTLQKNSPAVRQHQPSPDHSKPSRGKPMNAPTDTIAAAVPASFPLPYPGNQPGDDLDRALKMLHVLREAMSTERVIGPGYAAMLAVVLSSAIDLLDPIALLLDHHHRADDGDLYLHCRRQDIIIKMGNGGRS